MPIVRKLDQPILIRIDQTSQNKNQLLVSKSGHLESNFDKGVYKLIKETVVWKKLASEGAAPPSYADELILTHKENLRILREFVMLVVRDYNMIIDSMDETEKKLFKKHLEETKLVINPGLMKLKWSSKGILEGFVRECRRKCKEIYEILKMYKNNRIKIQEKCQEIQSKILIKIDKKNTYDIKIFEDEQQRHRKEVQQKLKQSLEEIRKILSQTYEAFMFKGPDIQTVWFKYVVQKIDMEIEESLKKCVKMSLLEVLKVVGDDEEGKENISAIPIFRLSVELENGKIGFKPNSEYLSNMMQQTTTAMVDLSSDFQRMEEQMMEERRKKIDEVMQLNEKEIAKGQPSRPNNKKENKIDIAGFQQFDEEYEKNKKLPNFHDRISDDPDVGKYVEKILANLKKTCLSLGELLGNFKKRESYYSTPYTHEKLVKSIVNKDDSASQLKAQIEKFTQLSHEINAQKTTEKKGCIVLDNTNIKNALVNVMQSWENTFLKVIEEKSCNELMEIYNKINQYKTNLLPEPTDHQQLKKNQDLLDKCVKEKPDIENRLQPLEDKFNLLDYYGVSIGDDFIQKRKNLREVWTEFTQIQEQMEERNQNVRKNMYNETNRELDEFFKETSAFKNKFVLQAPYSINNINTDKAFQQLNDYKENVKDFRKQEEKMRFGLQLFDIQYSQSADLEYIEAEIMNLETVWKQYEDWENKYEEFQKIKFKEVDIDVLDDAVDFLIRKVKQYKNEMKKWDVVINFKNNLETFKNSLPLIVSLKEDFMRPRHWLSLQKNFGQQISPYDNENELLLKHIFQLNILQYADVIQVTSDVAREEFKIENALDKIQNKWDNFNLELDPYKKGFKLKKAEAISEVLEDHMGILSAQKTTMFYENFKSVIEKWENTLQNIMEALDTLQQVQRQWLYLESIFASQQNDSDKQLLGDRSKFQAVSNKLNQHMNRINDDKNVLRALTYDMFLNDLFEMQKKLDESQKILNQLLERKRKDFPRFYFVSNDDLFELLGNSKDEDKVNKHIKKCFEGVKMLGFDNNSNQPGRKNQVYLHVKQLKSDDGESVELTTPVLCDLGIEYWLKIVEKQMRETLRALLLSTINGISTQSSKNMKWVEKWIKEHQGQLIITASQIKWTTDCTTVLNNITNNDKADKNKSWKPVREEKIRFIEELTSVVRNIQTLPLNKKKTVALITIEVHNRDIIEQLQKTCTSVNNFEWQKQLKFIQKQGDNIDCQIIQTNTVNFYGYEYQGNNGRLVVTSLTDRCYLTLTTAMHLKKGGSPQGPAGTGKTETVKDLGKSMAKYVFVYNCSDGLDHKSMAKMFSGLIQSGSWGCFDEFNRITLEVLSVVAQQIHAIFDALRLFDEDKDNNKAFAFEGDTIPINNQCAIFITMNPGYAGRQELPDNLKSLFRPISMMVPQFEVICEITLYSSGFKYCRMLAIKIVTLYNLMKQQLSKQDHYDFELRAMMSVLINAGSIKSQKSAIVMPVSDKDGGELEEQTETQVLMQSIKNMNIPKFITEDIPLFNSLITDLFPNIDMPDDDDPEFIKAVEQELKKSNLQYHPVLIQKVIQLYDTKKTRHGNMLVGGTLSGKSTVWQILAKTLKQLNKDKGGQYRNVLFEILNPKAVTINELFGYVDSNTMEWNDGVLSSMMGKLCKMESKDERWMVIDGPVDTYWIESMNTVLDDNKMLTLLNGDRISLPQEVGILMEVDDLSQASAATVSRCGMVYIDSNDLGWVPYAVSWIDTKKCAEVKEFLADLFEKWMAKIIKVKNNQCQELIKQSESAQVQAFCKMMDAFLCAGSIVDINIDNNKLIHDNYFPMLEKWFVFTLIWTVGASINEEGRNYFDFALRDIDQVFPSQATVYDYYVNNEKKEWELWEQKLGQSAWKPTENVQYHKMFVPTIDTTRNRLIIWTCLQAKIPILAVGTTGTGKTSLINGLLTELDEPSYMCQCIVFSANSSSFKTQEIIESKLIKRSSNKMIPDGKKGVYFIDDLNMPKKEQGSQPALELLRQWFDYHGWYDRVQRKLFKYILDVQFIAAMGPPNGGRAEISKRLQSKLQLLNFTFPTDAQARRIFQSILSYKFQEFEEEIKPLADPIANSTLNLFKVVVDGFRSTPSTCHYVFNLRDMSKVIQGVYQIDRYYFDTKINILRVWVHECLRVFHDRLINHEDRQKMKTMISEQLELNLGSNMKECTNEDFQDTIFVDFFDENVNVPVYQEVSYLHRDDFKIICEQKLELYNNNVKTQSMNIVLFKDAIIQLCKIHRIIKLSRGHGMLIGEGGSGRHSLTRLAAFLAEYLLWQVCINKNYKLQQFRDDIKKWAEDAGIKGKPGVFLFSDNEVVQESFLEDINNILTVGEIPNLFNKDDYATIRDKVKKFYLQEQQIICEKEMKTFDANMKISDDKLTEFFSNRLQNNFHIILCMSKTGDNLRNYSRMYPGLVNNTTIVWFLGWPREALIEVANKYLKETDLEAELQVRISTFFGDTHTSVLEYSHRMLVELKRLYYVTPTNYVELVKGYVDLLQTKHKQIGDEIAKLTSGLFKLEEAQKNSEEIQINLNKSKGELSNKQKECEDLLIRIQNDQMTTNENQKEIAKRAAQLNIEKEQIQAITKDAEADLKAAEPALKAAEEGLQKLTKTELAEIKSFKTPKQEVVDVCSVVMTILKKDTSWSNVKKELSDPNFMKLLKDYDKDNISQNLIKRIQKYTSKMTTSKIATISIAAAVMWDWVLAMESYGMAFQEIEPKRKKVNMLKEKLKKSEDELQLMYENDAKFTKQIEENNIQLSKIKAEVDGYQVEAQIQQNKLDNAEKLLSGLSNTNEGWKVRKSELQQKYEWLVGDCLISSAFLSYMGPFPSEYRDQILDKVLFNNVNFYNISHNVSYKFSEFLAKPTDLLTWQLQGLPSDQFSSDNGVLVNKSRRFSLMIDPQMQANSWIKRMELDNNKNHKSKILILDLQTDNFMQKIEQSVSLGNAVILQNVDEELDASLEPLLNKTIKKKAGKLFIYLGEENEVLYNENFRMYITTKMPNPRYKAEISTKVTLVNFTVKQKGLEEQLVSVIIRKMEINLENTRTDLIKKKAQNEIQLKQLDDDILRQLQESKIQLVDDIQLIKALGESKIVEEDIKLQIESSATAMIKTQSARENYRSLAVLGSLLYFIINDFSLLDNMYQFSLENYITLFSNGISAYLASNHGQSDQLKDKLETIGKNHKINFYNYSCRGLFEKDKQLLSLQMAVKLSTDIDKKEYEFFLRGEQMKNPSTVNTINNPYPDWINNWDMICELERQLPNFANIVSSFIHNSKDWKRWYSEDNPEDISLPLEWETKCDRLRKMIIIKTIRPDRVLAAVNKFVIEKIGESFVGSPQFNMESIYQDSNKTTSVIFILAPGVDPRKNLENLAKQYGRELINVSLGKGQEQKARDKILDGSKHGHWLFLANCHLSLNFLKDLEKLLEQLDISKNEINDNFRLFLSAEPNPKFPITLLQRSVRVTTEPPKGIKKNMERIYFNMPDDKFSDKSEYMGNFKKLMFSLSWFHSIVIERKKFKTLGWNVVYDFNDGDLETSEKILKMYIDEKSMGPIQWDAIKYLISDVVYGGRVTDEWDRRLMSVYAQEYFNEKVLTEKVVKLGSSALNYIIPDEVNIKDQKLQDKLTGKASPAFYLSKIKDFPSTEKPEAFGQHINAEISSQIADTNNLINSIISLEPQVVQTGQESLESRVIKIIEELKKLIPEEFDIWEARDKVKPELDQNPLKIMLIQEISRFNTLLYKLSNQLDALERGIKGLDLISEELESVMENLLTNRVPQSWKFLYHSLMPLYSWIQDLIKRCDQLRDWVNKGQPHLFWISGFSFPTGFTTALQQQSARKLQVPIDNFIWEFQFLPQDTTVSSSPKEGAYVYGLFLEGAAWDFDKNYLLDAEPMKLFYNMPTIHFKPIISEAKAKIKKGQAFYPCPTYMYPIRTGVREKPSFMFTVQLPLKPNPQGTSDVEKWVKRGTALLMSLAN